MSVMTIRFFKYPCIQVTLDYTIDFNIVKQNLCKMILFIVIFFPDLEKPHLFILWYEVNNHPIYYLLNRYEDLGGMKC